jgi:hypothetical protein
MDTIGAGFDVTADDLTVTGITTFQALSAAEQSTAAAAGTLATALSGVAALSKDYVVFTYGTDTYVYGDVGTAGTVDNTDLLIKVTGTPNIDTVVTLLNT